jgi:hypothetical protein
MDAASAASTEGTDALAKAVRALLKVTDAQDAIAVARDISHPDLRAIALAVIAETLSQAGDTVTARQLTLEALISGPWTAALRVVALLDPESLSSFAAERVAKLNKERQPTIP